MKEAKSEAIKHKTEKSEWKDKKTARQMEIDSIEKYEKLIKETKGESERAIFEEILADEKDHLKRLNSIIKSE
jgi:rubrerythrin